MPNGDAQEECSRATSPTVQDRSPRRGYQSILQCVSCALMPWVDVSSPLCAASRQEADLPRETHGPPRDPARSREPGAVHEDFTKGPERRGPRGELAMVGQEVEPGPQGLGQADGNLDVPCRTELGHRRPQEGDRSRRGPPVVRPAVDGGLELLRSEDHREGVEVERPPLAERPAGRRGPNCSLLGGQVQPMTGRERGDPHVDGGHGTIIRGGTDSHPELVFVPVPTDGGRLGPR